MTQVRRTDGPSPGPDAAGRVDELGAAMADGTRRSALAGHPGQGILEPGHREPPWQPRWTPDRVPASVASVRGLPPHAVPGGPGRDRRTGPLPTPGLATGLAFSVPRDVHPLPASLRNIHRAMRQDGLTPPDHGDLTGWADQGVLLLNTALTVPEGKPGAHIRAWRPFTEAVVHHLASRDDPVVFVLWGAKAQRLKKLIKSAHHPVITAPHPASRGIHQKRFRECPTFSRVNEELKSGNRGEIEWEIA